jgi:hypothetical protein
MAAILSSNLRLPFISNLLIYVYALMYEKDLLSQ